MPSLRTLSRGLLAGLAGSAAMHGFRFWWEKATHYRRKNAIFGFDHEADVNSAHLLASYFRSSLPESQAARLGLGLHYTYGATLGTLYAATRSRNPFGKAQVISFGVFLWLYADEVPIALTGVSNPLGKSTASHAGALVAHLIFAITVENTLRLCQVGPEGLIEFWRRE